jgi:hypothetical protein
MPPPDASGMAVFLYQSGSAGGRCGSALPPLGVGTVVYAGGCDQRVTWPENPHLLLMILAAT